MTVAVVGLIIAEKSFQVESLGPISLSGPKVTENSLQQVNNLAPNIQVKASKSELFLRLVDYQTSLNTVSELFLRLVDYQTSLNTVS